MDRSGARIEIHGAVQGVGFRPFIFRLASDLGLDGWVLNDANGVFIEVDADPGRIDSFVQRIRTELPAVASIDELRVEIGEPHGHRGFSIRASEGGGEPTAIILPDLATCTDCFTDIADDGDRRHRYSFTNCTNCGPRFSIVRELPYDRPNTTMAGFAMCPECRAEYDDPLDRRFHAQPTACPRCGPHLGWRGEGTADGDGAIVTHAAEVLRRGGIVALKGLGGYQLLADATYPDAVARLRARKHRPTKPFAVMVQDVEAASAIVDLSPADRAALTSPQAPIVLADREPSGIVAEVAPGNPTLGVMLPTTPLHLLVATAVGRPLVATSGNLTDEPICTDDHEAARRLAGIADGYLVHDRPIERHVDDSVVRSIDGEVRMLRRARGYAPLPIAFRSPLPAILAVGAHLKNTIAVTVGRNAFISQHIGDLETAEADRAFRRVIDDLTRMYGVDPEIVAHDLHPAYRSTAYAEDRDRFVDATRVAVQHHHAHLASCLVDNDHTGPALGVTWDGTGHGPDGTVWGGEFLLGDATGFERTAHLHPFSLPGGEVAVREPRRSAASALLEAGLPLGTTQPGLESFAPDELRILQSMMDRGLNTPRTTSAGRLFDAVAAILGVGTRSTFEGEAAIALEHAATATDHRYDIPITSGNGGHVVDWRPLIHRIVEDRADGVDVATIAGRFHSSLASAIVDVASLVGHPVVALTGGCFQNRLLTEQTASRLRTAGFEVLLHRRVPPNDGGISLGQVAVAAASTTTTERNRP